MCEKVHRDGGTEASPRVRTRPSRSRADADMPRKRGRGLQGGTSWHDGNEIVPRRQRKSRSAFSTAASYGASNCAQRVTASDALSCSWDSAAWRSALVYFSTSIQRFGRQMRETLRPSKGAPDPAGAAGGSCDSTPFIQEYKRRRCGRVSRQLDWPGPHAHWRLI